MHWAITGTTAAEIIHERADSDKPNMGLTNWRGAKVRKQDVSIAKNYLFQLSEDEFDALRSQSVISKGKGGRRYFPYAFTEQGVAMLSSVLHSERAIEVTQKVEKGPFLSFPAHMCWESRFFK